MVKIPLLVDNHNHFFTYSGLNKAIDLFHIQDKNNALQLLSKSKKNIIVAKGWFDSYYNFSENDFNPDQSVIIINNSLHKYFFNKKGAKIISKTFPEWVINNHNQIWVEKNLQQILTYISGLFKFNINNLDINLLEYLKKGIYINSDMYVSNPEIINLISKSERKNRLKIWTSPELYPTLYEKQKEIVSGVKIFTDGALGAFTAAIKNYTFSSNPILTYSDNKFLGKLDYLLSFNTDISIHAIGDLAIEQVIKSVENLKKTQKQQKIRIEHSQFITRNQAFRAKDLGIILCLQPNFNWDSVIYADRLSQAYCKANNPFRMLIDDAGFIPGKDLIFGSDGMPSGIDGCIQQSLFPPVSGQKLNLDEFVAGYCIDTTEPGYIQLEIDELKKKVVSDVILT